MQKTSQKLKQRNCRKQIADALDFPAQTSVSQEMVWDWKESSQNFSLKLSDFLKKQKKKINPDGCSLKMLEIVTPKKWGQPKAGFWQSQK